MRETYCDFLDLDSDESFQLFGSTLGGVLQDKRLHFDNDLAKGELVKSKADEGLWVRKWKITSLKTIILHKLPSPGVDEKKFHLIYYLNPTLLMLNRNRKYRINGSRNNMFIPGDVSMRFDVVPKQPFYLLEIAFTRTWLIEEFHDAARVFKDTFNYYADTENEMIVMLPCSVEEYKILYQLENSLSEGNEDPLFIRSSVYNLIFSFFCKVINQKRSNIALSTIRYEQLTQVETIIRENKKELPKLQTIAKRIGMSVSSLSRHFKLLYGKSIYEYYVECKMELAKEMILKNDQSIKEISTDLGYRQPSAFIESFSKHHGYSPGSLRNLCNKPFDAL